MLDKFLPAASFPAVPVLSCYAVIAPTDHRDTAIQAIGAAARFTVTEHQSLILAVAAKEIIGKRYYIVQQLLLAVLQLLQIQILRCNVRYLVFPHRTSEKELPYISRRAAPLPPYSQ